MSGTKPDVLLRECSPLTTVDQSINNQSINVFISHYPVARGGFLSLAGDTYIAYLLYTRYNQYMTFKFTIHFYTVNVNALHDYKSKKGSAYSRPDCCNGLPAVVLAEGLTVLQSLEEDSRQFLVILAAVMLGLAMLKQHLHFADQQCISSVKIYTNVACCWCV